MSKTDRLALYFRQFPPNTLITHKEIVELLWRGDPNGGPHNISDSIAELLRKIKKRPQRYKIEGYTFDLFKRVGYRMIKEVPMAKKKGKGGRGCIGGGSEC